MSSFGQADSLLVVGSGPQTKRKIEVVLIVNCFLISDTLKADRFMKIFSNVIVKRKYITREDGFNKWGISSKDGILFCTIRKGVIVDYEEMKLIAPSQRKDLH